MAVIVFYESTPIDQFQLTEGLKPTDHYWEFVEKTLSPDTINKEAEVISVFTHSVVTKELMDKMPKLRLIATRTTGYDHIDIDHATDRGIAVVNVPDYGDNTVAEHAFSLLLSLSRKLLSTVAATKQGSYSISEHTGFDLHKKTIGIIGMGRIGKNAAKIAKGFGMNVLAYDIYENEKAAQTIGFNYVSLEKLLEKSDIISLHTPLTPDNYYLINSSTIKRMKRGTILINTARGELVENRSLIGALESGQIAAAGLDAVAGERYINRIDMTHVITNNATAPHVFQQVAEVCALQHMPNVIITPHSAFNTTEAIKRINETTVENIIKFWYDVTPNKISTKRHSGRFVIFRHGESEWNALGKWTGTTDVHLSNKGVQDSANMGKQLKDLRIDFGYISEQVRTKETIEAYMNGSKQLAIPYETTKALNERDYGIYTGMHKDAIEKIIGKEAYDNLRRSWAGPVEGGESLRDVYERVIPFYLRIILPRIRHGQNVLLVAHGNSIRALIKYIENISDDEIGKTEMLQDAALVYEVDAEGRMADKETVELQAPAVHEDDPDRPKPSPRI